MKNTIKESTKMLIEDRYLLALLVILVLLAIVFSVIIGFSIHSSERQLISHYSAFGITHFYFDQWFYSLTFLAFQIIAAVLHVVISIKLLKEKGHSFAILFAWLGIAVVIIGYITTSTILGLRTLL
jgi:uncharacterized membrane protein